MGKHPLRFWIPTLLLLVTGANSQSDVLLKPEPHAVVEELHLRLLESMQRFEKSSLQVRFENLAPTIKLVFDFETIARIVCGRSWQKMDQSKKTEFIELFQKLSTATYARNFSSYEGESFKTLEVKIESSRAIVKTELLRNSGNNIALTYMLREKLGRWQIITVISQGVSDLSLKRSEYDSIIKSKGLDALIEGLKEQLSKHGL